MSGAVVRRFWHLGKYAYVFYRFELEDACRQCFVKPNLMLLDAGCGPNVSTLSHVPKDVFCIGIDINSKNTANSNARAKAKGYKNFSFVVADLTSIPFRDECFDVILSCDVLEHVESKQGAIQEIKRVCKSHGKFIGSTTNLFNPVMLFDSFLPQKLLFPLVSRFAGEHYERHSRFTPNGLLHSLSKVKFRKYEIKLLGFPPFRASSYEFSSKKLPWFAFLWIAFDSLTTKKLKIFKEIMFFFAEK
jgi:ubiquinone/menaquinone biosynthesis C-methylase UbiE